MTLSFAPDAIKQWPLDRLKPYTNNAKMHGADQVAKIAASMAEFGWTVPCLVADDGQLIAGHGRVLAGDEVIMPENAFLMLHDPSGMVMGPVADMRSMAEALDKIGGSLLRGYAAKSGKAEDEIAAIMAKETWLDAAEALDMGFADTMGGPVKMAASFDVSQFRNAPPEIIGAVKAKAKPAEVEPEPEPKSAPRQKRTPCLTPRQSAARP